MIRIKNYRLFLENKSNIDIIKLQSLVTDYIQPLIDDLDLQNPTNIDYQNVCWYRMDKVCWEDRFGENDTIVVSFYDDVDWEEIETLNSPKYIRAIRNFFNKNSIRLDAYGIKIVSKMINDEQHPIKIYFQFK